VHRKAYWWPQNILEDVAVAVLANAGADDTEPDLGSFLLRIRPHELLKPADRYGEGLHLLSYGASSFEAHQGRFVGRIIRRR
jgi:hypothetical protein